MAKGLGTWGSGNSAPEDTANARMDLLGTVAIMFVIAPVVTVVGFLTYQVGLVALRLRVSLLFGWSALLFVLWLLFSHSLHGYLTGPRELFEALRTPGDIIGLIKGNWARWLWLEVPTGFVFGSFFGTVYSAWRWWRRPKWEASDRRAYPWTRVALKRVREDIAAGVDGPVGGITIGLNEVDGKRVIQSDAEGGAHTLVTGGSGTGKTTAILMGMRDVIQQGRGLVVIDLKGSDDVPEQVAEWCRRHNRVFHHWTFQSNLEDYDGPAGEEGLSFYEPVGRGDATRRAGMLLATREWSAESDHYKKIVEGFLQTAFNLVERIPDSGRDAIAEMVALSTDPQYLVERAQQLFEQVELKDAALGATKEVRGQWTQHWARTKDDNLRAIFQFLLSYLSFSASGGTWALDETVKQFGQSLNTFKQSIAGRYLDRDPSGKRNINLSRVAREGQVVMFSLNSSLYPEPAAALGTMIIQDLKTVSAELRGDSEWFHSNDTKKRLHVYIDEFGALKADNTKTLLQQVRDARVSVTLSTQSVSDLAYHSPEFKDALLNTVASFLAMRPNTHDEAEQLAGLTGEMMRTVKQIGIEQSSSIGGIDTGAATGGGFLREEMGFTIQPHEFQELKIGEAIYISSGGGQRRSLKAKVIKEDVQAVHERRNEAIRRHEQGESDAAGADGPLDALARRLPFGRRTTADAPLVSYGFAMQDPDPIPVPVDHDVRLGVVPPPMAGRTADAAPGVAAPVAPLADPAKPKQAHHQQAMTGPTEGAVSTNVDSEILVPSVDDLQFVAPREGSVPLFPKKPTPPTQVVLPVQSQTPAAAPVADLAPPVLPVQPVAAPVQQRSAGLPIRPGTLPVHPPAAPVRDTPRIESLSPTPLVAPVEPDANKPRTYEPPTAPVKGSPPPKRADKEPDENVKVFSHDEWDEA